LRREYGYAGLPYTLVLDRQQRVVKALYGFGGSIAPVRDAVLEEPRRGGDAGAATRP
jgi:hypothetical protein